MLLHACVVWRVRNLYLISSKYSLGYGLQYVHTIDTIMWNTFKELPDKASGAQNWLTIQEHPSPEECLEKMRDLGYDVWVSDLSSDAVSIEDIKIDPAKQNKIALVFGNETNGVSDAMKKLGTKRFILPMYGMTQSFNVSASVAVTLTYLKTMRVLQPNLTDAEKELIKLKWLYKDAGPFPRDFLKSKGILLDDKVLQFILPPEVNK